VLFGGNKNINYEDKDQKKKKTTGRRRARRRTMGKQRRKGKRSIPPSLKKHRRWSKYLTNGGSNALLFLREKE